MAFSILGMPNPKAGCWLEPEVAGAIAGGRCQFRYRGQLRSHGAAQLLAPGGIEH